MKMTWEEVGKLKNEELAEKFTREELLALAKDCINQAISRHLKVFETSTSGSTDRYFLEDAWGRAIYICDLLGRDVDELVEEVEQEGLDDPLLRVFLYGSPVERDAVHANFFRLLDDVSCSRDGIQLTRGDETAEAFDFRVAALLENSYVRAVLADSGARSVVAAMRSRLDEGGGSEYQPATTVRHRYMDRYKSGRSGRGGTCAALSRNTTVH